MSKLVIFLPDVGEVVHELTEAKVTVGRVDDNTIHINDPSVSSHHAEIVFENGDHILRDLGSTNGIRINNKRLEEGKLCPGDRVRFGSVEGVFEPDAKGTAMPLPQQEIVSAMPASQSQRPEGFGNASPFARKAAKVDNVKKTALTLSVIGILIGLAAAVFIFLALEVPQL